MGRHNSQDHTQLLLKAESPCRKSGLSLHIRFCGESFIQSGQQVVDSLPLFRLQTGAAVPHIVESAHQVVGEPGQTVSLQTLAELHLRFGCEFQRRLRGITTDPVTGKNLHELFIKIDSGLLLTFPSSLLPAPHCHQNPFQQACIRISKSSQKCSDDDQNGGQKKRHHKRRTTEPACRVHGKLLRFFPQAP